MRTETVIDRNLLKGREYRGASRIDGPLVYMRNTHPVGYGELVEIIAPKLPYYNKAAQSSLLSLLNMALETKRSKGFFYKLFNGIGG